MKKAKSLNLYTILIMLLMLQLPSYAQTTQEPININTANAAALMTLNGIGPEKAQAIIDYRDAQGDFVSTDDLLVVEGIGSSILANNIAVITVD